MIGTFDDFGFETRQDFGERLGKKRPLIALSANSFSRKGKRPFIVARSEMPPSRS